MKLLLLSNGHGEDLIAAKIGGKLQQSAKKIHLAALPLVGTGQALTKRNIPLIGTVKPMPSGGFVYMDVRQFWKDIQKGLFFLTFTQFQTVRQWGQNGGKILAVGDILPLLLAYLSGSDYAFVGTAKSEYYIRDESGWLPQTSFIERAFGLYYYPWERALMAHPRCKAVFPRDTLTTQILQQWSIQALDLGNPMMDDVGASSIQNQIPPTPLKKGGEFKIQNGITILLLPGSRYPEAYRNWQLIIQALPGIITAFNDYHVQFLAAIAPSLPLNKFSEVILTQGWKSQNMTSPLSDSQTLTFIDTQKTTLFLSQHAYGECLTLADIAIAMAGTATEQFIGLGKPAFIIPGEGPQFTSRFAQAQTRLLGCSVILVEQPQQIGSLMLALLSDSNRLEEIAANGRQRMGLPGAAQRIAQCLQETLLV